MNDREKVYGLIEKICNGDSVAFSALAEMYAPLLQRVLGRVDDMSDEDIEDLRQEEMIAFYRAVLNFDRNRENIEFGLYAKICVTNSIISYKRAAGKRLRNVSYTSEDELAFMSDPESEPARMYEQKESERILGEQIEKTLSSYENEVWRQYVNGSSSKEIASRLKSSEKSIDNAIFRIRRKLKILLKS